MEHNKVSIKEVVSRILSATKVKDTSYIPDIMSWITEACAFMRSKWALQYRKEDVGINNCRVEFPCGLVSLMAVEYEGKRLEQRNVSRHPSQGAKQVSGTTIWISAAQQVESPNGNTAYVSGGITLPQETVPDAFYVENGPGSILTSMATGTVTLHYKAVAHDKEGWPLIPDAPHYKEALYWYCRKRMIESGWQDPVLNWNICDAKWTEFSAAGKDEISYPSTNRMEAMADMITLIPPQNYFYNFSDIWQQ